MKKVKRLLAVSVALAMTAGLWLSATAAITPRGTIVNDLQLENLALGKPGTDNFGVWQKFDATDPTLDNDGNPIAGLDMSEYYATDGNFDTRWAANRDTIGFSSDMSYDWNGDGEAPDLKDDGTEAKRATMNQDLMFTLDFGAPVDFNTVWICWEDARYDNHFQLQYSNDGENFAPVEYANPETGVETLKAPVNEDGVSFPYYTWENINVGNPDNDIQIVNDFGKYTTSAPEGWPDFAFTRPKVDNGVVTGEQDGAGHWYGGNHFNTVNAQFLRIYFPADSYIMTVKWPPSIWELEVYNVPGTEPVPSSYISAKPGTTVANAVSNATVYNKDGVQLNAGDFVGTGSYFSEDGVNRTTFVVPGDMDGNGIITGNDYIIIMKWFLEDPNVRALGKAFEIAADIDQNDAVQGNDYIVSMKHFLGMINVYDTYDMAKLDTILDELTA